MYLSAYVNKNGVFLVRRHTPTSRYFLKKFTFGKEHYVEVRISYETFEKIESAESFAESWNMANAVMVGKLEEKRQRKIARFKGNA